MKCTGERTGCERCTSAGLACIYAESRVGKVPGNRAKKARGSSISEAPPSSHIPLRDSVNVNQSTVAVAPLNLEDAIRNWNPDVRAMNPEANGMEDIFLAGFSENSNMHEPNSSQCHQTDSASGNEFLDSSLDFDFGTETVAPSTVATSVGERDKARAAPSSIQDPTRTASPNPARSRHTLAMDSQCVQGCCQIILNLESYIGANVTSFDILLGILKKAIDMLNHLVAIQRDATNVRINGLLGVIMCQITLLFESGCEEFLASPANRADSQNTAPTSFGTGVSSAPRLGGIAEYFSGFNFGVFQVDPQEQRAWRARVILKELQQASEILQRIVALGRMGQGHNMPQTSLSFHPQQELCFTDIERRLESLCEDVRRVSNP